MTTRFRISLLATLSLLVLLLAASAVHANGFLVYDHGADAMGKASAVAGSVTGPNAVWYNPAGLSFSKGFAATVNGALVFTTCSFKSDINGTTTDAKDGFFPLGQVFASAEVLDWLHVGVGAFPAFGLGIKWPDNWMGRASVIENTLTTFTFNPVVSFKVTKDLSVAVGFQAVRGTYEITQGTPDGEGTAHLGFGGWGFGGNIGIMYRVVPDKISLGLTYRSRVKMTLDGSVDFTVPSALNNEFHDQGASTSATLPDVITVGITVKPIDKLAIGLDVNYIAWDSYDKSVVKFSNFPTSTSLHKYHGIAMFRLGGEYETPIGLIVRAGIAFEQNPAPQDYISPSLPDAHYLDVTFGVRAPSLLKWLDLDFAYMFIWSMPSRSATGVEGPEGVYKGFGHVLALMATVRFGDSDKPAPAPAPEPPPLVAPPAAATPQSTTPATN
jgi:long-chain fatty acid transport protein